MRGVGVTGVLVKDVALEGEVEMWLFQGIHLVGERRARVSGPNRNLAILEGIDLNMLRIMLL